MFSAVQNVQVLKMLCEYYFWMISFNIYNMLDEHLKYFF